MLEHEVDRQAELLASVLPANDRPSSLRPPGAVWDQLPHLELRELWRTRIGPRESVHVDVFLHDLSTFLRERTIFSLQPYARTADRLASPSSELGAKLRAILDFNRDDRVTIAELRGLFHPSEASLEDLLLSLALRTQPCNLYALNAYCPRIDDERALKRLVDAALASPTEGGLVLCEGPCGAGTTSLAIVIGQDAYAASQKITGGVYYVDVRRRSSTAAVLVSIAHAFQCPLTTLSLEEILDCLAVRRAAVGPMLLILDHLQDALEDAECDTTLQSLQRILAPGKLTILATAERAPMPLERALPGVRTMRLGLPSTEELEAYLRPLCMPPKGDDADHCTILEDSLRAAQSVAQNELSWKEARLLAQSVSARLRLRGARTRTDNPTPEPEPAPEPEPLLGALVAMAEGPRRRLIQLAVVPGSFSLEAAQALGIGPHELAELSRQGLLERAQEGRFAVHPLVAHVIRYQLPGGETEATQRHARARLFHWIGSELLRMTALYDSVSEGTSLAWLDRERHLIDEVFAALIENPKLLGIRVDRLLLDLEESWTLLRARVHQRTLQALADSLVRLYRDDFSSARSERGICGSAWSLHGKALLEIGEYDRALLDLRRALEIRKSLGDEESQALSCQDLGACLFQKGALDEAISFFQQSLQLCRSSYGPGHPRTAPLHHALGSCLRQQGNMEGALQSHQTALDLRTRALGEFSLACAESNTFVGLAFQALARFDDAATRFEEALRIHQEVHRLNPRHRDIARASTHLALVLMEQGRSEEARALLDSALGIYQHHHQRSSGGGARGESVDSGAADLAQCYQNIAVCELRMGQYVASLATHSTALSLRQEMYGQTADHPHIALSHLCLSAVLCAMGRFQEGLDAARGAHAMFLRLTKNERHPRVGAALLAIATCHYAMGKYDAAVRDAREILRMRRTALGEEHQDTARAYSFLGSCLVRQGNLPEGLAMQQKAVSILMAALGADNLHTLSARVALGRGLLRAGEWEEGREELTQALEQRVAKLGPRHPSVADAHAAVALALVHTQHFDLARTHAEQALDAQRPLLGAQSLDVAESYHVLGLALQGLERPVEALGAFRKAHATRRAQLGGEHEDTRATARAMADLTLLRADLTPEEHEALLHDVEAELAPKKRPVVKGQQGRFEEAVRAERMHRVGTPAETPVSPGTRHQQALSACGYDASDAVTDEAMAQLSEQEVRRLMGLPSPDVVYMLRPLQREPAPSGGNDPMHDHWGTSYLDRNPPLPLRPRELNIFRLDHDDVVFKAPAAAATASHVSADPYDADAADAPLSPSDMETKRDSRQAAAGGPETEPWGKILPGLQAMKVKIDDGVFVTADSGIRRGDRDRQPDFRSSPISAAEITARGNVAEVQDDSVSDAYAADPEDSFWDEAQSYGDISAAAGFFSGAPGEF